MLCARCVVLPILRVCARILFVLRLFGTGRYAYKIGVACFDCVVFVFLMFFFYQFNPFFLCLHFAGILS